MRSFFIQKSKTTLLSLCCALSVVPSLHASESGTWALTHDNDGVVGTDYNYTSGLFFRWSSPDSEDLTKTAPFWISTPAEWLSLNPDAHQGWGVEVSQQMWAPKDISQTQPQPNERPYAGLLYVKNSIYEQTDSVANQYSFSLGLVGPDSYTEEAQKIIHSIIGSPDPQGWDNQIQYQPIAQLGVSTDRLIFRKPVSIYNDIDMGWMARAELGNYQSEVALGGTFRFGEGLSDSFGSTGFTHGNFINTNFLSNSKQGLSFFSGYEFRYRFYDLTIEGDLPDGSPRVDTQHLQTTVVIGGVFYQPRWGVGLSLATSSADYEQDDKEIYSYGSITIFLR